MEQSRPFSVDDSTGESTWVRPVDLSTTATAATTGSTNDPVHVTVIKTTSLSVTIPAGASTGARSNAGPFGSTTRPGGPPGSDQTRWLHSRVGEPKYLHVNHKVNKVYERRDYCIEVLFVQPMDSLLLVFASVPDCSRNQTAVSKAQHKSCYLTSNTTRVVQQYMY